MAASETMTVAGEWESYRKHVIPADAPPVQITESRRAFVAGFFSAMNAMQFVSTDAVNEDDGAALLGRLYQETLAFYADVKAGRA